MIRRRIENDFLLIPQSQHARVAGDIARNLAGPIAPSARPDDLARATKVHATGFDAFDAKPPLDSVGRPMNHDEISLLTLLACWRRSAEVAATTSPYCGFLVSLLSLQRSAAISKVSRTLRENFEINKHQQAEMEQLARLRPELNLRNDVPLHNGLPDATVELTADERSMIYDYRLMLFSLQLALELTTRRRTFGEIASVPSAADLAAAGVRIGYRNLDGTKTTLTPFPFANALTFEYTGRRLSSKVYDHDLELLEELEKAPVITLQAQLVDGQLTP